MDQRSRWRRTSACHLFLICAATAISSEAQTFNVLATFNGANGSSPQSYGSSLVQGADGNLYGTTNSGGGHGRGTVFKIAPGGALTNLYSLCSQGGACTDGAGDVSGLVRGADGNFYGETVAGGTQSVGSVFKITPGGALTTVYNFASASPLVGAIPGLIQGTDGNFYGTSRQGGSGSYGSGTIFKLTPGGVETLLYSFSTTPADGSTPGGMLVQGTDGNFYGTTGAGGANQAGTVFKITPDGKFTTLYTFSGPDGDTPRGALIQATDGNFYGTTVKGGDGFAGTIFRITPGGALTTLYSFQQYSPDGNTPQSGLIQGRDGNLYGTTTQAGNDSDAGTIFSITLDGKLTTLYAFNANIDGAIAWGALIQASNGTIYGTTNSGGANGLGTVFSLQVTCAPPQPFTTLAEFDGTYGNNIQSTGASMVQGPDGNFYGTAASGGANLAGTVFKITPAGALTALYSFVSSSPDGSRPLGGLALGSDGNFYATTSIDGANGQGTVFQITPAGVLTTLYTFGSSPGDGSTANGLIQAADGNFYGTTLGGGANNKGTVFQVTPAGALTTLYSFSGLDGANPSATLLQATDGYLYGTTQNGGPFNGGTVFRVGLDGTLNTVYMFKGLNGEGSSPQGALIQGSDGNFYGTTVGGDSVFGTVFQLTPDGTLTTLYRFCAQIGCPDGGYPYAGLLQASDGNFYGTTSTDGPNGAGTVFQVTPGGALTTLYGFRGPDGQVPWGALVQGSNGIIYGTTQFGGRIGSAGTVFSFGISACGNVAPSSVPSIREVNR